MPELEDKVVIVTGGGRGIGRAIALAAADAGARIVVADTGTSMEGTSSNTHIGEDTVTEIISRGGTAIATTDSVTTTEGANRIVAAALSTWGRVDGLVCCAAIVRHKPFLEVTEEDFEQVVDVHLKGHFLMYQATLKAMIEKGIKGSLIGISSGYVYGDPNRAAYRSAKAGVVALTKSVAHVAADHGARANIIAPIANTRLTAAANLNFESDPDDIGPMAVYLLSDQSGNINGEVFSVSGNSISIWEDPYERHTARHHSRWQQRDIEEIIPWLRRDAKPLPPFPPLPPKESS